MRRNPFSQFWLTLLVLGSAFYAANRASAQFSAHSTPASGRNAATAFSDASLEAERGRLLQRWLQDVDLAKRHGLRVAGRAAPKRQRLAALAPVSAGNPYVYFPGASASDGKFLAIAGFGSGTLTNGISMKLAVPAGSTALDLAIFDGDIGGLWDHGSGTATYTLFEDGNADGLPSVGETQVAQWSSSQMADNVWSTLTTGGTIGGTPINPSLLTNAQAPSGHYFFRLVIKVDTSTSGTVAAFKLRTSGSIRVQPQDSFNITAPMSTVPEAQAIYPNYPSLSPCLYDGTWDFYPYVSSSIDSRSSSKPHSFEVWDGDLDYGDESAPNDPDRQDTDDPNTPNSVALLPAWAQASAPSPEGVAVGYGCTGQPGDDRKYDLFRLAPSVQYDVTDPSGVRYTNTNPSGNLEWEVFRIETDPALKNDPSYSDAAAPGLFLPPGVYQVHVDGLDLSNLNAFRFEYDVLGTDSRGNPVKPLLPYTLGDMVFNDLNSNGVYEPAQGETGIANVSLSLLDDTGNILDTTTTNASGQYSFNVEAGEYAVRVEAANFLASSPLVGRPATTGTLVLSNTVTTANVLTYDFGFGTVTTGSIGDLVWLDLNGNGTRDAGEPGLGGVTVTLAENGTTIAQTTTDVNGFYLFTDLDTTDSHSYSVTLTGAALTGLTPTYDSDGISTANTASFTLAAASSTVGVDFGYVGTGSIGNLVWNEQNVPANTTYDLGTDTGLANVRVVLTWDYNGDGSVDMQLSTTTDAQGYYLFTGLPPATASGSYRVRVDTNSLPYGMVVVSDPDGISTPGYSALTLTAGSSNLQQDFGYRGEGTLGDLVWLDANTNGVQDSGELGIANVAVQLSGDFNYDGTPDYSALAFTDANGRYYFKNLPMAQYTVTVAPGSARNGWTATYDLDGTATPHTTTVDLRARQTNLNLDFGYSNATAPAAVGNFVWNDANANGVQDAGEVGLSGVTVNLYSGTNTLVATQTTRSNGSYFFANLAPGSYSLQFTVPSGYALCSVLAGGDPALDSDANPADSGKTAPFTLTSGQNLATIDAGAYRTATVGDFVWNDLNRDGLQGTGEAGISGATVSLFNSANVQIGSTQTTGTSGAYSFSGLAPGSYYLRFTLPAGYSFTSKLIGTDASRDSDADPADGGKTAPFTLTTGQNLSTLDAGGYQGATVGDYVWLDNNTTNGIQDAAESGVTGVAVSLFTSGGVFVSSTTTGSGGAYSFSGLAPGDYYVQFTAPNNYTFTSRVSGSDRSKDSDAYTTTGKTDVFTLTSGQVLNTIDAGLVSTASASVGDYVWEDANGNGIQDATEVGLAGVTITLFRSTNVQVGSAQTTDGSGFYRFTGLTAGDYYVQFTLPSGYVFSAKDATTDATDSDVNPGTGKTDVFTLAAGANNYTVDAGAYQPISIGDFVWLDANANGIQDYIDDNGDGITDATDGNGRWDVGEPGEGGLAGAKVTLFRSSDNSQVGSVTTPASGYYLFSSIASGSYYVQFTLPSGYSFSPQNAGADTSRDSDANVSTGKTATFTVSSGQSPTTIDAGAYQGGSIGDFVWNDVNQNGLQDAGETGLAGAVVKLFNATTNAQAGSSITTTASGAYLFTGLLPGSYYVQFTPPTGYLFSGQDLGNDALDSDVNPVTGVSPTVTLVSGQSNTTIDAGASSTPGGTIGDRVWLDANRNGIQDAAETSGIANVVVKLFDASTNLQVGASKTTASNGSYSFTGLDAGSFYLTFTLPTNYAFSGQNAVGSTSATDSDPSPATGKTAIFTLGRGQVRNDQDAGANTVVTTASIGDYVWYDLNGNGIQEAGEPGLSGATVKLYNATTNAQVGSAVTSGTTGAYAFSNLAAGSYYLKFTLPTTSPFAFTLQDQGSDDTLDSDVSVSTGQSVTFTLGNGQALTTIDCGATLLGSIGQTIWYDVNRDGIWQSSSEAGLAGVTVTLTKPDGTTQVTTTSSTGSYLFSNLRPGTYSVAVNAATISTAVIPATSRYRTYDYDGFANSPDVASYSLGAGEDALFLDFGYSTGPLAYTGPRYRTYSHSSWGAPPSGNNTGTILNKYFTTLYGPSGVVSAGGIWVGIHNSSNRDEAIWTTRVAVTNYLPHLTTVTGKLGKDYNNPTTTNAGVLASQLLAAKLNRDFSAQGSANGFRVGLGALKYNKAGHPFNGKTVDAIINMADLYIGGDNQPFQGQGLPSTPKASQIAQALADINSNFINGNSDKGMLIP